MVPFLKMCVYIVSLEQRDDDHPRHRVYATAVKLNSIIRNVN